MWFWITVPLDFIESQRPKWLVAGVATATAKGTGWGNASDWPLRGRHRGWDSTHLAVSGHQRCFSFQTLFKNTEYTVFWPVFFLKYNLTDTSATGFFEVQYSTSQSPRSSVMIGSNCIPQCVCYMYMNSILEGTFFYSVEELYCGDIFQAILRLKIIFGVRIRIGDMLRSGLRLDVHL